MGDKRKNYVPAILDAVTATTVSAPISVTYADKVTMLFTATAGESVFHVQGSLDGIHYETAVVMVHNAPNNASQNIPRLVSATVSSATELYALDLQYLGYEWIQIRADVTSGSATADVYIEY